MADLRTLYRPVGLREMEAILETDGARFPPRHPDQATFYPVINFEYAEQIATRWNTKSDRHGFAGFVTRFSCEADYIDTFEEHVVGARIHRELWVPAEELDEFNRHIVGRIELAAAYYAEGYTGSIPQRFMLKGHTADEQIVELERIRDYSGMDFALEIIANRVAVQINFAYWVRHDFGQQGLPSPRKVATLQAILNVWKEKFPAVALVGADEAET